MLCLSIGLAAVTSSIGVLSVTGAGATFPYPIYSKWFTEYDKLHPDIDINYQPVRCQVCNPANCVCFAPAHVA